MHFFTSIFLLLLVTISGCIVNPTGNIIKTINEPVHENNIETKVYFCPRDDCQNIIKNTINSAKTSAHCAFFDLDLKDVINTIAKKSKKADVKVVIDKNNYEEQIKGPGIKIANSKQYMHNKVYKI